MAYWLVTDVQLTRGLNLPVHTLGWRIFVIRGVTAEQVYKRETIFLSPPFAPTLKDTLPRTYISDSIWQPFCSSISVLFLQYFVWRSVIQIFPKGTSSVTVELCEGALFASAWPTHSPSIFPLPAAEIHPTTLFSIICRRAPREGFISTTSI